MRERVFDPEKNRALMAAFKNFVNETGADHSQIAHELGVSPGTILGWMHGTIELQSPTLAMIRCFLEKNGPVYLRAAQCDNQADRDKTKWHTFPQ